MRRELKQENILLGPGWQAGRLSSIIEQASSCSSRPSGSAGGASEQVLGVFAQGGRGCVAVEASSRARVQKLRAQARSGTGTGKGCAMREREKTRAAAGAEGRVRRESEYMF